MTAAIANQRPVTSASSGLRPIDSRRDMAGISRLIQTSFGRDLDDGARRMLRDMRFFGRAGWAGWLLGHLFLPPAAYPAGFIWEHEGRLVGNASLLPVAHADRRWLIANVAVDPDYRRRGIGRSLVQACLEQARRRGAGEVVLQVASDNAGAIKLYRSLGFETLSVRSDWVYRGGRLPVIPPVATIRSRRPQEFEQQWQLARTLFPEGVNWPYRLERRWLEPDDGVGRWLSPQPRHWVAVGANDRMLASLTALPSTQVEGVVLVLLVPEAYRDALEMPLLRHGLNALSPIGQSLWLSYPAGQLDQGLRDIGFHLRRTLTWMGVGFTNPSWREARL